MNKRITILYLEDEQTMPELVEKLLLSAEFDVDITWVKYKSQFKEQFRIHDFDLILADYSLPDYDGLSALKFVRDLDEHIPFILFSGSIGEAKAIESLREGCTDYVLKQNIKALVPVIKRALREYEEKIQIQRAQKALEASELKLRSISSAALDGIIMLDPEGKVSFWNQAAEHMFGYTGEEIMGKKLHDLLVTGEMREKYNANFSQFVNTGKGNLIGKVVELEGIHKSGKTVFVELSLSATKIDGKWHAIGVVRDISSRKKNEQIQRSLLRITSMANSSTSEKDFFKTIYEELGNLLDTCELYIGMYDKPTETIHNPYIREAHNNNNPLRAENTIYGYVLKNNKALLLRGSEIKAFIREQKLEDPDPEAKSWMGVPLIVNERSAGIIIAKSYHINTRYFDEDLQYLKLIASQVSVYIKKKEYENRLLTLSRSVEQSPLSIVITDVEGNIEYANPAFCRISGYALDEVLGQNPRVLKSGESSDDEYRVLWETITRGNTWKGLFHNKRKNGELYWEDATIGPVLDESNNIIQFIALKQDITGQKKAEDAFYREKHMLDSLMNNISDQIYYKDKDSRFVRVNKGMLTYFGLKSADEIINKSDFDLFASEHAEKTFKDEREIIRTGQSMRSEEQEVWPDGRVSWVSTVKAPLHNENGRIIGTFGISRDITKQKKYEKQLEQNEAFLSALLDAIPIPVFYKDKGGKYLGCNEAFTEFFSTTKEEMIGKTVFDLNPEEFARKYHEMDVELLNESGTQKYEAETKSMAGKIRNVVFHKAVFYNEQNEVAGLIGTMLDITEIKAVQQELRASKDHLNLILESVPAGIMIVDSEKESINYINPAALKLLQRDKTAIIGKSYQEFMRASEQGKDTTGNPEHSNVNTDFFLLLPDETKMPVLKNTVNLEIDGRRQSLVSFVDISQLRETEQALAQAQKLESIGQLAAGIAHEINTPIQFVGDNTHFFKDAFNDILQLLKVIDETKSAYKNGRDVGENIKEMDHLEKTLDLEFLTEEIPRAVEQSLDGIERISKIVKAMKEFSHPGSKEKTRVDINRAINNTITVSRNEWKYIADLHTDFQKNIPPVPLYPDKFNQVILNMIINAAHAIAECPGRENNKGTITIITKYFDNTVEIRISDNGTGIPEDIQKKIFDPFFTTKEIGKGTGQGLSISHDVIVKKHSGRIHVESTPGKGTTFTIRLPMDVL